MKTYRILFGLFLSFFVISCINEKDLDQPIIDDDDGSVLIEDGPFAGLNVSADFNYETSKEVDVTLNAPTFLSNAVFEVYAKSKNMDSLYLGKATFDEVGNFNRTYTLSSQVDSILIFSDYIGLIDDIRLPIEQGRIDFDYRPYYQRNVEIGKSFQKPGRLIKTSQSQAEYTFIDTFDFLGVPDNLAFSDVIEQNLLDDINASLPEGVPGGIPATYPEYLAGKETSIVVTKEADIWVTFVSEGAGYRNVLGYYSYPLGQEPESVNEIVSHNVVFPNTSFLFSGGGLIPGDRVYLGRFPANTVISWFLAANGWTGSGVSDGNGVYYSNPDFNPESTEATRDHMVLLYDEVRELTLLGFEDLRRDSGSDDDFNDAVFYAKANPVDAIQVGNLAEINTSNDSDGDGINDELDDFPFDPNQAFNNFSPSVNSTGKVVYEDLWPFQGDYDFNDLSMAYAFNLIANADNLITRLEGTFVVDNIGGSLENGFAIMLPISGSEISSVDGQIFNEGYITTTNNGVESTSAPNESVIFIAENVKEMQGDTITMNINFQNPIDRNDLGDVPFNPFIVVNKERAKEVHLPDFAPSSKAGLLGTGDDFSDPSIGRYYKTSTNLPWAMNIYEGFAPPLQYPRFINWANSGGTQDLDWYVE